MMDFQKINGLHGLNHQIIEYSKKEKVITDKRTDGKILHIFRPCLWHTIFRILLSSPFQKYITSQVSQVLPLFVSVVTWWYWISILRYWLVLGGTGSEQGSTGYQCDMLSENIWFTCCKPSNYPIIGEGKSDYGQTHRHTDRQTDKISYLRLDPYPTLICSTSALVVLPHPWCSSTEQAHFLLFTKLSHLIFARTGSTRLGTVHQCCA